MVFTDLPLTQEFKTLGIDDYLWVQALFNHEELERLRGQQPNNPHQQFLWRIIRMGVINPEAGEKAVDTSTGSMSHSSAIRMQLWKMWREAESRVSLSQSSKVNSSFDTFLVGRSSRDHDERPVGYPGADGLLAQVQR